MEPNSSLPKCVPCIFLLDAQYEKGQKKSLNSAETWQALPQPGCQAHIGAAQVRSRQGPSIRCEENGPLPPWSPRNPVTPVSAWGKHQTHARWGTLYKHPWSVLLRMVMVINDKTEKVPQPGGAEGDMMMWYGVLGQKKGTGWKLRKYESDMNFLVSVLLH